MSHQKERQEKNCLNCNAEVLGRFCQVCGQENIETKESFWSLATHFVYDITHFDGKFFSTLKYLIFRPGFLSQEYLRGRRIAYLHPIRMYVFTSAIFFLIFFSFYKNMEEGLVKINEKQKPVSELIKELEDKKKTLNKSMVLMPDSSVRAMAGSEVKKQIEAIDQDIKTLRSDSTQRNKLSSSKEVNNNFDLTGHDYDGIQTVKDYDSIQNSLPPNKRENFLWAKLQRQNLLLQEKYNHDNKAMNEALLEKFWHLFPQMLFVSLPFFALFLTLLYFRKKELFYVNHAVFTIHLYCATFILILTNLWIGSILNLLHLKSGIISGLMGTLIMFYWYKAIRNFYSQSRRKTVLKYILLFFMTFFMNVLLFLIFFAFSYFVI